MAMLALAGCTDDNYDLSDIDTTTRVNVTDLVLPVNIDPIRMGDVLKFDPESKIQPVTIGGKEFYALVQNGDFSSEAIDIPPVKAAAAHLDPTYASLDIEMPNYSGKKRAVAETLRCPISEVGADFNYSATNIDPAIESINYVETKPFRFTMHISLTAAGVNISEIDFRNVRIRAPKGLTCEASIGSYDKVSGIWTIPELKANGSETAVSLLATGVNTILADAPIRPDHSLSFTGEFRIESAEAYVNADITGTPSHADLTLNYVLDDFEATAFSGRIDYTFDGISIPAVSLEDIPDFLKGDKSNIALANPQIYLNVNNPVSEYPIHFDSGLLLQAERTGYAPIPFRPSRDIQVTNRHGAGPYNYLLGVDFESRNVPTEPVDFNTNLEFVPFPTLGDLLTTPEGYPVKGLPQNIDIKLENTRIPSQPIENFRLEPIDGITGHYSVVAPLALKDGSFIYYTDRRDGWNDEGDIDDLTVTTLELTAKAVNNCPVALQLTVWPLVRDKDGNVSRSGAKVESNTIPANETADLSITLDGEIKGLDGFDIEAVLTGGSSQDALTPSQTLDLTDIRAKVSGYYQTDF